MVSRALSPVWFHLGGAGRCLKGRSPGVLCRLGCVAWGSHGWSPWGFRGGRPPKCSSGISTEVVHWGFPPMGVPRVGPPWGPMGGPPCVSREYSTCGGQAGLFPGCGPSSGFPWCVPGGASTGSPGGYHCVSFREVIRRGPAGVPGSFPCCGSPLEFPGLLPGGSVEVHRGSSLSGVHRYGPTGGFPVGVLR
jgi:hypothetical protein